MKKIGLRRLLLATGMSCLLAACGGGGDAGPATAGGTAAVGAGTDSSTAPVVAMGTLRLALTDAPACGFDKVFVTVVKVRVHQSGSSGDGEPGWSEIVLDPGKRLDLLSLTNGVLEELGQQSLPAGKYQQLRLVLAENGSTAPFANAVVPTGTKDEVPLSTPSAEQSGLKLQTNMDVIASQTADFVIDFDACRSIVTTGGNGNGNGSSNAGKYLLKPVLTVSRRLS